MTPFEDDPLTVSAEVEIASTGLPVRVIRSDGFAALADSAVLTATSLHFTHDLTLDEWLAYAGVLLDAAEAVRWWLGDLLRYGEHRYGEKYSQALEATGLSYGSLADCVWVADRFAEVSRRREGLGWSHHREVAALDPADADALLDAAEAGDWSARDLRKAVRTFRRELGKGDPGPLPAGVFDVIVADCPWEYDFSAKWDINPASHYPTMTVEEICALGSRLPAADESALYLWSPAPKLIEALRVMEAWGFEYRSCAIWDKKRPGVGYWWRSRHELLLLGTRGEMSPPAPEDRWPSVIAEEKTAHSAKPVAVYEMIEQAFPNARRLELFARDRRDGWTVWGNEVEPSSTGTDPC